VEARLPELPDIEVYLKALRPRVLGRALQRVQIAGLLLLRTAVPPIAAIEGRRVTELRRVGKRIAFGFDNGMWLVFHLMIAGRLHWRDKKIVPDGRRTLAAFDFDSGTLSLTEAGSQKRASLHLVEGEVALAKMNPGGIEVLSAPREEFGAVLTSSNHTLKRSLTDPRLFSGIGNAYSD
jgi:formamidopyrimidine-DNA glycosylase